MLLGMLMNQNCVNVEYNCKIFINTMANQGRYFSYKALCKHWTRAFGWYSLNCQRVYLKLTRGACFIFCECEWKHRFRIKLWSVCVCMWLCTIWCHFRRKREMKWIFEWQFTNCIQKYIFRLCEHFWFILWLRTIAVWYKLLLLMITKEPIICFRWIIKGTNGLSPLFFCIDGTQINTIQFIHFPRL